VRHPSRNRLTAAAALTLVLAATACSSGGAPRTPGADRPDVIWVGDLETGDLSQFKDTPWNITRGGAAPEVVDDPEFVREGSYALKVAIPTRETEDKDGACCDPRSELEPDIGDIDAGDDLWFGFSTKLAADFPADAAWQVVTQWKQRADGSPALSLNVEDGQYIFRGGAGHPEDVDPFGQDLGAAAPGQWADWVVHIAFSPEPTDGFVEIWRNGEQVLERFSPDSGTMYPGEDGDDAESYLKTGYYRNGKISRPGVLYLDGWRVGTTREAVSYRV